MKTRLCANCHTEFNARDKRQVLCKACKYEAHKAVMREYHRRGYTRPHAQYIGTSKPPRGARTCKCGKPVPDSYRYPICDKCRSRMAGIDDMYGVIA